MSACSCECISKSFVLSVHVVPNIVCRLHVDQLQNTGVITKQSTEAKVGALPGVEQLALQPTVTTHNTIPESSNAENLGPNNVGQPTPDDEAPEFDMDEERLPSQDSIQGRGSLHPGRKSKREPDIVVSASHSQGYSQEGD